MHKLLTLIALSLGLLLAGCNTVHGIGKDIKTAGEKIEDAASSKKK